MSSTIYFTITDLQKALDNNYIDQLTDENRDTFFDKVNIDEIHKAARGTFEFYFNSIPDPGIQVNSVVPELVRDRMITFALYRLFRRKGYVPEILKEDYLEVMEWLRVGDFSNLNVSTSQDKIRGNMEEEDLGTLCNLYEPWTRIL